MGLMGNRCFPIKCCCWVVAFFIFLISGSSTQEFCQKDAGDGGCQQDKWFRNDHNKNDVTVLTVATEDNHGFQRYLRSAKVYGINVEVLGKGEPWSGGDMNKPGGGMKINLLKKKLEELKKNKKGDHIIVFTDSYDVLFLSSMEKVLEKFKDLPDSKVLFAAEKYCWPDSTLADIYPYNEAQYPYLNSGGFIGYLDQVLQIVQYKKIVDTYDDQLYYTEVYLNKEMRDRHKISLDHNAAIFQNLNGASTDIQLVTNGTEEWPYVENTATEQRPLIMHGNGPSKIDLNQLGNYLAKSRSQKDGCVICEEKRIKLKEDALPIVLLAVFIEEPTPFMTEYLQMLLDIDYPKTKLHLLLRNNVDYHETEVDDFFKAHSKDYASAKRIKPSDSISEAEARTIAKERSISSACDYLFSIDSLSRLEKGTLRYLISSGYDVIAPMIVQTGRAWSNFWGAINAGGYYSRSSDYMDIVNNLARGIWNVPFITNVYLIKKSVLLSASKDITYVNADEDPDMAFCRSLRNAGIFMHVSNEHDFGHLINTENFDVTRTHPDIYQVMNNKIEWEQRYLHKEYVTIFEEDRKPLQPCPDVFWFPLMSERFCKEWIAVMDNFGKWSSGTNEDERLPGGYEAVPTRDIHMTQVGLERQWLYILKEYVTPLQKIAFEGYTKFPPEAALNFVVRYRPDEQPSLRPHFDTSSYTINLALNTPHVDYEGGGCRFVRYDCSVRDTKLGWLLMHPGRVTHLHEGLKVTNGTRYIMISFIDP